MIEKMYKGLLRIFSILSVLISLSFYSCNQETTPELLTKDNLFIFTSELASSEYEGRLAGSEGYNKAAALTAEKFKSFGLEPLGDSAFFQFFNIEYNKINHLSFSNLTNNDSIIHYEAGKDFVARGFSGSGDIEAPVVFCGYGISRPGKGYDDYANIDVEDKIVMIFKEKPRWKLDNENIGHNSLRKKAKVAESKGAKGIIYISFPNAEEPQKPIGSVKHGKGNHLKDMPQIHVANHVANQIARESRTDLKKLQSYIDGNKQPKSKPLETIAHIFIDADYQKKKRTMNVVGMLEGTDDSLKNEYVVLGAHLDHVGNQGGKVLFPGANDNASGAASITAVADALSREKDSIKRSVIVVAFSSEEQGLQGATHFVKNSPVDRDHIVAMLNMDCVAHGDSIVLGSGRTSPELYKMARKTDSVNKKLVIDRTWGGGGADATPFYKKGVPTLYFATKNSYTHLHLPTDTPETLNQDLHYEITKLAYKLTKEISQGKYDGEKNE
ncbi:MAG: M20/M25/M40 family metallo-hydrolase [Bacteroidales bacterium]